MEAERRARYQFFRQRSAQYLGETLPSDLRVAGSGFPLSISPRAVARCSRPMTGMVPKPVWRRGAEARQWNSLFKTATGAAQHMFRIDIK